MGRPASAVAGSAVLVIWIWPQLMVMFTGPIFFFNDTATTEIYTLSLHDALPILVGEVMWTWVDPPAARVAGPKDSTPPWMLHPELDRACTRLHPRPDQASYAAVSLKPLAGPAPELDTVTT